jgi:hypothetical protein
MHFRLEKSGRFVLLKQRMCLFLCAGLSDRAAYLNDLFLLDRMTLRWTALDSERVSNQAPLGRFHHGFAAVAGKAYVFGGMGYDGVKTWILKLIQSTHHAENLQLQLQL